MWACRQPQAVQHLPWEAQLPALLTIWLRISLAQVTTMLPAAHWTEAPLSRSAASQPRSATSRQVQGLESTALHLSQKGPRTPSLLGQRIEAIEQAAAKRKSPLQAHTPSPPCSPVARLSRSLSNTLLRNRLPLKAPQVHLSHRYSAFGVFSSAVAVQNSSDLTTLDNDPLQFGTFECKHSGCACIMSVFLPAFPTTLVPASIAHLTEFRGVPIFHGSAHPHVLVSMFQRL